MSDTSQGPGWWQNADGKWYPPAPDAADPTIPIDPVTPADQDPELPETELIITPMSDPDVVPGEPTEVIPVVPVPTAVPPPVVPSAAAPATTAVLVDEPPEIPWWKHGWVVAVAALLLTALVVGLIWWATSDDDPDELNTSQSTLASSLPSTSAPATTAPASTVPQSTAPATSAPATSAPATSAATTTEAATTTLAPTTTAATTTQAPTTTAAPTTAPTTTAAPTTPPPTAVPAPVVAQGTGDAVAPISIPGGSSVGVTTITHDGDSNFEVLALDQNGNPLDLVVATLGPYEGTVIVPGETRSLDISTEGGAWRVEVNSSSAAQQFDSQVSGSGDDVIMYTGQPGTATITHSGAEVFEVRTYSEDGTFDTLVETSGEVDQQVEFPGMALVQVIADGEWTISVS